MRLAGSTPAKELSVAGVPLLPIAWLVVLSIITSQTPNHFASAANFTCVNEVTVVSSASVVFTADYMWIENCTFEGNTPTFRLETSSSRRGFNVSWTIIDSTFANGFTLSGVSSTSSSYYRTMINVTVQNIISEGTIQFAGSTWRTIDSVTYPPIFHLENIYFNKTGQWNTLKWYGSSNYAMLTMNNITGRPDETMGTYHHRIWVIVNSDFNFGTMYASKITIMNSKVYKLYVFGRTSNDNLVNFTVQDSEFQSPGTSSDSAVYLTGQLRYAKAFYLNNVVLSAHTGRFYIAYNVYLQTLVMNGGSYPNIELSNYGVAYGSVAMLQPKVTNLTMEIESSSSSTSNRNYIWMDLLGHDNIDRWGGKIHIDFDANYAYIQMLRIRNWNGYQNTEGIPRKNGIRIDDGTLYGPLILQNCTAMNVDIYSVAMSHSSSTSYILLEDLTIGSPLLHRTTSTADGLGLRFDNGNVGYMPVTIRRVTSYGMLYGFQMNSYLTTSGNLFIEDSHFGALLPSSQARAISNSYTSRSTSSSICFKGVELV